MQFLYEKFDILSSRIDKAIPDFVVDNLNQQFEIRPYQIEAFARFFDYLNNYEDEDKQEKPYHLLFNMATGSGKTLIMAGLILYLYKKGYRNFLFFVNSNNIIEKTKDNFMGENTSKYLFGQNISFDNKTVNIQEVGNFEDANPENINICFTTIQKLHSDLYNQKENAITWEDFKRHKIILLSDEAHHMQAKSKNGQGVLAGEMEKSTWENTVERIFKQNKDNLLLEFTATLFEDAKKEILEKYENKVLYRYDLKEFRNDGYSKEISILRSDLDDEKRMLQAIVLSQYRQDVAGKYGIHLKPIVLFKAQKTIEESKENQKKFEKMIDKLSTKDIVSLRKKSNIEIIEKAFEFFKSQKVTDSILVNRLKHNFSKDKILNVNEENLDKKTLKKQDREELVSQQKLLNSLEDKNNQIRAIFAVQKLNEGWDVLNLFDIVRLFKGRGGSRFNKPGKTTIAEAQLIGRGARYFPFVLDDAGQKYSRKFDEDLGNDLRTIEQLDYHSINDSKYIDELKKALIKKGLMDSNEIEKELKLKDEFKKTSFYKSGIVYVNRQKIKSYKDAKSFKDLGVSLQNIKYNVSSGQGREENVFEENESKKKSGSTSQLDIVVKDIPKNIIRSAISKNDFFQIENLRKYGLENISSISEFIENYLYKLSITFSGKESEIENISNIDYLDSVSMLLSEIESELKKAITEYEGTAEFEPESIKKIFIDKILKLKKDDERADGQEDLVEDKKWYAFNANYGTSEEKKFVRLMSRKIKEIGEEYKEVYLVRNEMHFKLYNFKDGQGFAPDFVLFLRKNKKDLTTYQIFIEPKGAHLKDMDKWKEEFLEEIKQRFKGKIITFNEDNKYRITGVPFYSYDDENEFYGQLQGALN